MENFIILLIFLPFIIAIIYGLIDFSKSESGKEFLHFVFKTIIQIVLIIGVIIAITC